MQLRKYMKKFGMISKKAIEAEWARFYAKEYGEESARKYLARVEAEGSKK